MESDHQVMLSEEEEEDEEDDFRPHRVDILTASNNQWTDERI